MKLRCKRFVVFVLAAICVVLIGYVATRGLESYFVRKLCDHDLNQRATAANVLSRLGTDACIPGVISAIKSCKEEDMVMVSEHVNESHYECTAVVYALYGFGSRVIPYIDKELDSIGETPDRYSGVLLMLRDAIDGMTPVRLVGYR